MITLCSFMYKIMLPVNLIGCEIVLHMLSLELVQSYSLEVNGYLLIHHPIEYILDLCSWPNVYMENFSLAEWSSSGSWRVMPLCRAFWQKSKMPWEPMTPWSWQTDRGMRYSIRREPEVKKNLYLCSLDQGFLNLCKLGVPFEGLNIVLLTLVPPKSTRSFQS